MQYSSTDIDNLRDLVAHNDKISSESINRQIANDGNVVFRFTELSPSQRKYLLSKYGHFIGRALKTIIGVRFCRTFNCCILYNNGWRPIRHMCPIIIRYDLTREHNYNNSLDPEFIVVKLGKIKLAEYTPNKKGEYNLYSDPLRRRFLLKNTLNDDFHLTTKTMVPVIHTIRPGSNHHTRSPENNTIKPVSKYHKRSPENNIIKPVSKYHKRSPENNTIRPVSNYHTRSPENNTNKDDSTTKTMVVSSGSNHHTRSPENNTNKDDSTTKMIVLSSASNHHTRSPENNTNKDDSTTKTMVVSSTSNHHTRTPENNTNRDIKLTIISYQKKYNYFKQSFNESKIFPIMTRFSLYSQISLPRIIVWLRLSYGPYQLCPLLSIKCKRIGYNNNTCLYEGWSDKINYYIDTFRHESSDFSFECHLIVSNPIELGQISILYRIKRNCDIFDYLRLNRYRYLYNLYHVANDGHCNYLDIRRSCAKRYRGLIWSPNNNSDNYMKSHSIDNIRLMSDFFEDSKIRYNIIIGFSKANYLISLQKSLESTINMVVLYMISHGSKNGLYLDNDEILYPHEVYNILYNSHFKNPRQKLFIIVDSCRSGIWIDEAKKLRRDIQKLLIIQTSCDTNQISWSNNYTNDCFIKNWLSSNIQIRKFENPIAFVGDDEDNNQNLLHDREISLGSSTIKLWNLPPTEQLEFTPKICGLESVISFGSLTFRKEIVDKEIVRKEIVREEIIRKEMVDEEIIREEIIDEEIVGKEMVDEEIIDESVKLVLRKMRSDMMILRRLSTVI